MSVQNGDHYKVKSQVSEMPGRINIDDWKNIMISGVKNSLATLKQVPAALFVFVLNPNKRDTSLLHVISMAQFAGTQDIKPFVASMAKQNKVYGYATVSEAWSTDTVDKDYEHGDLAKRDDKKEIVLIVIETKHEKKCIVVEMLRDANGNPSSGEVTETENFEGRLAEVLYDVNAVSDLN